MYRVLSLKNIKCLLAFHSRLHLTDYVLSSSKWRHIMVVLRGKSIWDWILYMILCVHVMHVWKKVAPECYCDQNLIENSVAHTVNSQFMGKWKIPYQSNWIAPVASSEKRKSKFATKTINNILFILLWKWFDVNSGGFLNDMFKLINFNMVVGLIRYSCGVAYICIDQILLNRLKWQWFNLFKIPSNSMNILSRSQYTMFGWIQKVLHKFDLDLFVVENQAEFIGKYYLVLVFIHWCSFRGRLFMSQFYRWLRSLIDRLNDNNYYVLMAEKKLC